MPLTLHPLTPGVTPRFAAQSMFDAAGFEEVARRRPQRPVVRLRPV